MRSAIALISLLALLLVVPLVTMLALSCGDAEGLAKLYENPTWPCRPDAVSAEGPGFGWEDAGTETEYGICWQRCQAHQSMSEEGDCLTADDIPDWGVVSELAVAREWCKNEDYHTPTYDQLLSLLDNCEDVGIDYEQDGGPADGGVVHVTQYECEGFRRSDARRHLLERDPLPAGRGAGARRSRRGLARPVGNRLQHRRDRLHSLHRRSLDPLRHRSSRSLASHVLIPICS
jgi:hypothetical protein